MSNKEIIVICGAAVLIAPLHASEYEIQRDKPNIVWFLTAKIQNKYINICK